MAERVLVIWRGVSLSSFRALDAPVQRKEQLSNLHNHTRIYSHSHVSHLICYTTPRPRRPPRPVSRSVLGGVNSFRLRPLSPRRMHESVDIRRGGGQEEAGRRTPGKEGRRDQAGQARPGQAGTPLPKRVGTWSGRRGQALCAPFCATTLTTRAVIYALEF